MVSQNRLKLYIFKMQRFFCNIYPRPAQYFQYCRFLLLLKCIPPTHVYGILTFKRDITQLYSENLLKMPKCVFFSKFSYLSTFTPVFFTYQHLLSISLASVLFCCCSCTHYQCLF